MAEIDTPTMIEPPPQPVVVKVVNPTLFWIVSGVLAAGIITAYALLDNSLKQTRADVQANLETAAATQRDATAKAVAETREVLNKQLVQVQESAKKLEADKETLQVEVAALRKEHDGLATSFKDVSGKQTKAISDATDDLSLTKQNVQKVEVKVKYLDDRVSAIEGRLTNMTTDINKLNEGSTTLKAELKREQEDLRREVAAVGKKGNVTEDELRKLENKALAFESKVLSERAKQAAQAARDNDYKKTLQLLDFKE
jgi:predicted  nucleic acid-binding Zn-ribbon protein